ncbi:MAG: hypothetical protein ACWA6X_09450 [Bauldia sp.]
MTSAKRILAGMTGAAMMCSASTVLAADVQPIVPVQPPVVVVPPPAGFDWQGPYAGAFLTLDVLGEPFGLGIAAVGGQVGFNIVRGSFLFGPQLRLGMYVPETDLLVTAGPRAGVILGAEERILLYAAASFGWIPQAPDPGTFYTFGGGVEFGLGERFSVFTEARALGIPGIGCCGFLATTGANVHF